MRPANRFGAGRAARRWLPVALVLACVVVGQGVRAQEPLPAAGAPPESGEATSAPAPKPATAVVEAGREGFSVRSADGAFALRLHGYLQIDGRFFVDDAAQPIADTWVVRRARPVLEGTLFRFLDFKLMPDFGSGQTELYDGYLEARLPRSMRLRIGKFRPPIGLERLQSARDLVFVERAAPTLLVPNRDVGVQLAGKEGGGRLEYQVGLFNGVVDGGRGDFAGSDGREVAARLVWRPFARADGDVDLGVGLAASRGEARGDPGAPLLPSYKTFGAQTFFRYRSDGTAAGTAVADGERRRITPQAFLYAGPLGVLAEYVRSGQRVRRGEVVTDLAHEAWQLQLSWVLTGERNGFQGVGPERPFDPAGGGRGAWIVAVRATGIDLDEGSFPRFAEPARSARGAESYGACLSWNLAPGVRWLLDLGVTRFDGGASGGADRTDEKQLFTRFQVAF